MVYISVKNGWIEPILGSNASKIALVFKNAIKKIYSYSHSRFIDVLVGAGVFVHLNGHQALKG